MVGTIRGRTRATQHEQRCERPRSDRLGAPSGSIYHRFRSRDALVASLWLRAVERFQEGFVLALGNDDPITATRAAALFVLEWSRANIEDARILLLYRSSDFLVDGWPPEFGVRNRQQRARVAEAIGELCDRLGANSRPDRRRVTFAVVDLPYGAVRGGLAAGVPPTHDLDSIVDDAVVAVIGGIGGRSDTSARDTR